jgi:hypothetical protein
MARAQDITLTPRQIAEGARNVRLRIERADGRPFTANSDGVLSVGIAFGRTLVMFDAKPDRPGSPRILTVTIRDTSTAWSPAPRAGDNLLIAVYLNKRPITTAVPLAIVSARSQSTSLLLQALPGLFLVHLSSPSPAVSL